MEIIKEVKPLIGTFEVVGPVYIGDPCYILGNQRNFENLCEEDFWGHFCDKLFEFDNTGGCAQFGAIFDTPRGEFVVFGTAYGDGCYRYGPFILPVDAGLLSVIPWHIVKYINEEAKTEINIRPDLAVFAAFGKTISIKSIARGDFQIGKVKVKTS